MPSLAPKDPARGPESYYADWPQRISDDLASPKFYTNKQGKKVNALDETNLRGVPVSFIRNVQNLENEQALAPRSFEGHLLPPPASTPGITGIRRFCASQWQRHKGPILVFSSQFFAALMNLCARLLELGDVDEKLHPMQLLFWRMLLTIIPCLLYVVWRQIPHGVLGSPEVRWLLAGRGFFGFFGIWGVWYSIKYLPLAEATVITFLAPNLSGYLSHIFLGDPYTRTEQLASLLALGGVVLITKPASLFSSGVEGEAAVQTALEAIANATMMATQGSNNTGSAIVEPYIPTTPERLGAIGAALLGVVGSAFTFTILRAIGSRAHPLMSVNYFGAWTVTVASSVLFLAPYLQVGQPELQFALPSSAHQWGFLLVITACGFAVQYLLTKGLAAERSNRATAMTYTHMLFAAGFDRFVWGTTMGWMSVTGCAMIIAGAVWVAAGKQEPTKGMGNDNEGDSGIEGIPMLGTELEDHDDDDTVWEP
ncbi:hypothetical protein ANO14919_043950 [Xylariales sp. No.14919]|nr:hypothetical protein ANO14919_043950 [Xylariales sp. No.14919]